MGQKTKNATKRPAEDVDGSHNFTITLDFTRTEGTAPENEAESTMIRGIRPEVLTKGAGLFERLVAERGDAAESEELVVPMPQGDVKTMQHILSFLGSECSSDEAKNHCWPLPWTGLNGITPHQLFHASILKWLLTNVRQHGFKVLVDVLALAHYIDAQLLVEVLGAFLARELLLKADGDNTSLLTNHHEDLFQPLSLHVRLGAAKFLSSLLLTQYLDIHFRSLVDALALSEEVWSSGWAAVDDDSTTWGDDFRLARMLSQRCRLQQNTPESASTMVTVHGISEASIHWNWLKDSITRVGEIYLKADHTTTTEDWEEMTRLVSKNKSISFVSLEFHHVSTISSSAPGLLLVSCTTKLDVWFSKACVFAKTCIFGEVSGFECMNDFLKATLPSMVFLEELTCCYEGADTCIEEEIVEDICTAVSNLKTLKLYVFNEEVLLSPSAIEAFTNYNPTTHTDPLLCMIWISEHNENVCDELKDIMEKNPRLRFQFIEIVGDVGFQEICRDIDFS